MRRLLEASGSPLQASLAREIGALPPVLNRWLKGARTPKEDTVRAIGAGTAKVLGIPEIEEYLRALALYEHLISPKVGDARRIMLSAAALLRGLESDFTVELRTVVRCIATHENAPGAFLALSAMRGKHLAQRIAGSASSELAIDEVLWVLDRAGIDFHAWVRRDEAVLLRRVVQRAAFVIDGLLARNGVTPSQRGAIGVELQGALAYVQLATQSVTASKAVTRSILSEVNT